MNIDNLSGQRIGQYELREVLGIGGMGVIYRAYQPTLGREVAIKLIARPLGQQMSHAARFQKEAKIIAGLNHANVIPIYEYGTTPEGIQYIVMPLLTGGTLLQRLNREAPLPSLPDIADLLNKIAQALDYAHGQGVIHRDIKASNIMFDNQDNVFLVDFGIAKLVDATNTGHQTSTGLALGTYNYMAPEQWHGQEVTAAVDQYALGILIYLLVTGHLPFEGNTPPELMYKHLNEPPTPLSQFRPDVPPALRVVLERAMAKKPGDRFPTVMDFAHAFETAIHRKGKVGGALDSSRPRLLLVGAVGIVALIVVLLILVSVLGNSNNSSSSTATGVAVNSTMQSIELTLTNFALVANATNTNVPIIVVSTAIPIPTTAATTTAVPPTTAPTINTTAKALGSAANRVAVISTPIPPTLTPITPTATLIPPSATPVPPTLTPILPTATLIPPTLTPIPPTVTRVPSSATPVLPTVVAVIPTIQATPTVAVQSRMDQGIAQVQLPTGCFQMGSNSTQDSAAKADEQPTHQVCVTGFWLDQYAVTNADYQAFIDAGGYTKQSVWSSDGWRWVQTYHISGPQDYPNMTEANQPRVGLSWYEADAYARWRGGRLPTAAEWEYAARGLQSSIYPWNGAYDTAKLNDSNRQKNPVQVGSYEAGKSWIGAYDMAGNSAEWVADWYDPGYYQLQIKDQPTGSKIGTLRELRGGSWNLPEVWARSASRMAAPPDARFFDSGCRVVLPVTQP